MSRRPTQLQKDVAVQRRADDVLRAALRGGPAYWEGQLRAHDGLLAPGLVCPEDWKVYRDLLHHAERNEDEHPQPEPVLIAADVAAVVSRTKEASARLLRKQLESRGLSLELRDGTLWVGPGRLVSDEDARSIRAVRDELAALVETTEAQSRTGPEGTG